MENQSSKKDLQQPNQAKLWALVKRPLVPAKLREENISQNQISIPEALRKA
jgi:hypothetical protein